ncbi:3653_t:CDS:2, partial [Funneliformis mosseae]
VANNIEQQKYAVFSRSDLGPAFGQLCDLYIVNNSLLGHYPFNTYPEVKMIFDSGSNVTELIIDYEIFQTTHIFNYLPSIALDSSFRASS